MSAKAINWAWSQKVYPAAAIVLQALADEADDLGICGTLSVTVLSQKSGVPVRSLYRVLDYLKSTGRLFIHQQWSTQGLRESSQFELNFDRPGDAEFAPRCRRAASLAAGSAPLAGLAPSNSDVLAQRVADRSAILAESGLSAHASSAEQVARDYAVLAEPNHSPNTVVVSLNKEQQQQRNAGLSWHSDVATRLRQEVRLGPEQVRKLCEAYSDDRLTAVLDYVMDRCRRGLVQKGKSASYFLAVVRDAEPESLMVHPASGSQESRVAPAEEVAAAAIQAAAREAKRQAMKAFEDQWSALSAAQQDATRTEFMTHLATENPVVHQGLRGKPLLVGGLVHRLLLKWLMDHAPGGQGAKSIAEGGDEEG